MGLSDNTESWKEERGGEREKQGERRQKTKSRGTNWGSVTGTEAGREKQRGGKGTVAKADGGSEPSRSEAEIRSLGRKAQSMAGEGGERRC